MSRYIKWDDVVSRYKAFGDIVDDADSEQSYIQYAESYIDGMLGVSFTLPFSSNNATVKDLCIDVAFAKTQKFKDSDKAAMIMADVTSTIAALVSGKMVMVVGSGSTVATQGEPVYGSSNDYVPTFGLGEDSKFHVDSSYLYDEGIDRDG